MKRLQNLALAAGLAWALMLWQPAIRSAFANHIIMTVDPAQSQINLSGNDNLYGASIPQAALSDYTTVDGHFLVDFNATAASTSYIQFVAGHGSSAYELTAGGANFQPSSLPANFALQDATGTSNLALRDLSWDWSSSGLSVSPVGQFASSGMHFTTLSGTEDVENANVGFHSYNAAGVADYLDSGVSTITQVAPGSWRLDINFHYSRSSTIAGPGITTETLTTDYDGTIVATAQFGADNLAVVIPYDDPHGDVLGGSTQVGGVSATFSPAPTSASLPHSRFPPPDFRTTPRRPGCSTRSLSFRRRTFRRRRRFGTCNTAAS